MRLHTLYLTIFLLGLMYGSANAQSYQEAIRLHREAYKGEFLKSAHSPLMEGDLHYLRFYKPDSTYRVVAAFRSTPGSKPFDMPTYSGITKEFVKYGELHFNLEGKQYALEVYRNLALGTTALYKNHLFIPFKDSTNGQETYGGGRYLDLETTDLTSGSYLLDFNKAYNPYCAYSEGFNCPIPPRANHLTIDIKAGEQNFGRSK
jgi:uncharacterized protein